MDWFNLVVFLKSIKLGNILFFNCGRRVAMPSGFRSTNNPPAHKFRLTEKSRNTGDNVNPEPESLSACVGVACFIRLVDGFACGISG